MRKRMTSMALSLMISTAYISSMSTGLSANAKSRFDTKGDYVEYRDDGFGMTYYIYKDHAELVDVDVDESEVIIPEYVKDVPVTIITDEAFINEGITFISIPATVTDIGTSLNSPDHSFSVEIAPDNKNYINIDNVIYTKDMIALIRCLPVYDKKEFTLPDSVAFVYDYAFKECSSIEAINVEEYNDMYTSEDGVLFSIDKGTLYCYPAAKKDKSYKIPDSVNSVSKEAFRNCDALETVDIPDTIFTISNGMFEDCDNLDHIVIPDSVSSIYSSAFYNCKKLADITFSDNTTEYISNAFYGTAWFDAQPDGPVYCGKYLYKLKGNLPENSTVTVKDGTKGICEYAFVTEVNKYGYGTGGAPNIAKVVLPDGIESIGQCAFYDCQNLKEINLPDSISKIANSAFSSCTSLKKVSLPKSLFMIELSTFSNCNALEEIEIPENIDFIADTAFIGCESLKTVTIKAPLCDISGNGGTFCNSYELDENSEVIGKFNGTIRGYDNSTAQKYAEKYGYKFVSLGKSPTGEEIIGNPDNCSPGDINGDGSVNAVDASIVLSYYARVSTNRPGSFLTTQMFAADVNRDYSVNAIDASTILSYYAYASTTNENVKNFEDYISS